MSTFEENYHTLIRARRIVEYMVTKAGWEYHETPVKMVYKLSHYDGRTATADLRYVTKHQPTRLPITSFLKLYGVDGKGVINVYLNGGEQ